jgi:hypothetical protein
MKRKVAQVESPRNFKAKEDAMEVSQWRKLHKKSPRNLKGYEGCYGRKWLKWSSSETLDR